MGGQVGITEARKLTLMRKLIWPSSSLSRLHLQPQTHPTRPPTDDARRARTALDVTASPGSVMVKRKEPASPGDEGPSTTKPRSVKVCATR